MQDQASDAKLAAAGGKPYFERAGKIGVEDEGVGDGDDSLVVDLKNRSEWLANGQPAVIDETNRICVLC